MLLVEKYILPLDALLIDVSTPISLISNPPALAPVVVFLNNNLAVVSPVLFIKVNPLTSNLPVGLAVPNPKFPLASSVIACVQVIAFPAVPDGAVYQRCMLDN